MQIQTLVRLRQIRRVLIRHGLQEFLPMSRLPAPVRLILGGRKRSGLSPRGARLRSALEDLGPIFVKFGQTLSTRRDLLPDDVAEELIKLQDQVPPFDGGEARSLVEAALKGPIGDFFQTFEETPLASASVAQVHAATLKSGEKVVVKVLRPGMGARIEADLRLLKEAARWVDRVVPDSKRLKPIAVVQEFEKTLLDELDLVREAANAADIRRRFEHSEILYIPKVYFDYTRRNVLVMERISGIPIGDIARLQREGVDLRKLAERGVEIFFTQVLRDSLFHADMHPGNIFATPDARYIAVDFGIVGSISDQDKLYIADNFRAFFNRDYRRVAELHVESGWIPRDTRVGEFEAAIRAVCEPIFERPLKDISYGHLLLRLFQVAHRFNMAVQPQLVLLQKTLLNIEGLGRQLYPDLDLWQTAKPLIEGWFRQELGPSAGLNKLKSELPQWAQHWADVPMLGHRVLTDMAQGQLRLRIESEALERLEATQKQHHQRLTLTVTGSALMITGAVLLISPAPVLVSALTEGLALMLLILGRRSH